MTAELVSHCIWNLIQSFLGLLNEFEEVEGKTEQRFAIAGEPVCVVCGRYGEYICNEVRCEQLIQCFHSLLI